MRAAVCTKYGSPEYIKVVDVAKPSPRDTDILLKIYATSVSSGDARIRRADPPIIRLIFGWSKPRKSVLGVVVAGEVEAVGPNVTKFKVGDRVFGSAGMQFGAHAEYQRVDESGTLAVIPKNMSYTEAAAIPFGATTALHFLKKGTVQKGQKVLVYGASGAIGSMAVQLVKEFGAEVTAVCSGRNAEWVKELGADHVIDYTKEDFTKNGVHYDVIFETVGKTTISSNLSSLKKNGKLLLASASFGQMFRAALTSLFGAKKVISGVIKESAEDMEFIKRLIEEKKLCPVIDSTYELSEISQAHTRVDGGHKRGNVIVTMNQSNERSKAGK